MPADEVLVVSPSRSIDVLTVTAVVPTRNSARTIAACLESLAEQDHPAVEVIVVDNASTDSTASIAANLADRVEAYGPERCAQRNRGASLGTGELLAFVDSDMVLTPAVLSEAARCFTADPTIGSIIVDEQAFGTGPYAPSRALEKQLCAGDASVEAARIFRRGAFEAVGGYDERLHACEDWDLADRVAALGWRTGRISAPLLHDEGHVRLRDAFVKKQYYGRGAAAWNPTASGHRRARPLSLLVATVRSSAPLGVRARLVVLKVAEWSGFAAGYVRGKRQTSKRQTSR